MKNFISPVIVLLAIGASKASADDAAPLRALAKMPVREVTVFKDGHAFVLHNGKMPVEPSGDVLMDYLPAPCWARSGPTRRIRTLN